MSEKFPNPADESQLRKYGHGVLLFTVCTTANLATLDLTDKLMHAGFTEPLKDGIAVGVATSSMLAARRKS